MKVNELVHEIQMNLKVPKDLWNDFGKYPYRNAESILQAVKELLPDGFNIIMQTRIECVPFDGSGVSYIAWADVTLMGDGDSLTVSAPAFIPKSKKGMDSAQLTGAAISYARKYALAGMFAIDGTRDSDAPEVRMEPAQQPAQYKPYQNQQEDWGYIS